MKSLLWYLPKNGATESIGNHVVFRSLGALSSNYLKMIGSIRYGQDWHLDLRELGIIILTHRNGDLGAGYEAQLVQFIRIIDGME